MTDRQHHDLFRPWAKRRRTIYRGCAAVALLGGGVPAILVNLSIAPPTPTDIVMSLIITPILFIPLLTALWDSPGENRTLLEKSAEFSTVFLIMSGITELTWELPFVILEKAGKMKGVGPSDHVLWVWWSFGAADSRYITGSPVAFGVEFTAVLCGIAMLVAFRLTRKATTPNERLKGTWIALVAVTGLLAVTVVYMAAEWHQDWTDIHGGAWGVYLKFWAMGAPWLMALPVLPAMLYRQIDYLYTSDKTGVSTGHTWKHPGRPTQTEASRDLSSTPGAMAGAPTSHS